MALIKNRKWKKESPYHTKHNFTVSMGNEKMGRVMSFSVSPIVTCASGVPCCKFCYAHRLEKRYTNVKVSWARNLELLKQYHGDIFVDEICAVIDKKKVRLFRWHVGGDIFEPWYLDDMCAIAARNPDVKFWAFTKQFGIIEQYDKEIPKNLNIVLSIWPPHVPSDELKEKYGCCYFQDAEKHYDVPKDAFVCDGDCEMCQVCVTLEPGKSVVIYEH